MKKIQLVISAILLLVLCGCSGVGMRSTYWRNDDTGEWLIGLTEDNVIYDCKVWDIASKNESDGVYSIEAQCGSDTLDIALSMVIFCPIIQRKTLVLRLLITTMLRVIA